jgi:chemotaxis protein CheD
MNLAVVGIADCRFASHPDEVLVTYALGSCVAVAAWDPVARMGGLLHYMLPEGALDKDKARRTPHMFADTGIPLLITELCAMGAVRSRMVVRLAGGAVVMDEQGIFNIGKRNALAAKKILFKESVMVQAEALGGTVSRTVRLEVASGRCWVREGTREDRLLGERRTPLPQATPADRVRSQFPGREEGQWRSGF